MSALTRRLVPGRLRQRRPYVVAGVIVAVVVVAGVYLLGFTSAFSVRHVTVSGVHQLTSRQVLAAARVPHGRPLARLDTRPIAKRVAALPGVARVDVKRDWPDGVRIVVTERAGAAYIVRGGGDWLVDGRGVVFQRVTRPPPGTPRLLTGRHELRDDSMRAALSVATRLPRWLAALTLTITAGTPDSVTLGLTHARTVVWGGTGKDAAKAQALAPLLKRPGRVYDVSSPKLVTVR